MTHLVSQYGYWAVALFVLAESFGVPVPGETAVIIAGTYAGHNHNLSPWVIFAVAAAAAVAGGNVGYGIGRFGGYRLVRRYGSKVHFDEGKLKIGRYLFDRYGEGVVFFGRFVSILRTYAAFLAGTVEMRFGRFEVANAAGGVIWAATFTTIAYVAGDTLRRLSGTLAWAIGGVAVVAIALLLWLARRHAADLAIRANAAYPDEDDD